MSLLLKNYLFHYFYLYKKKDTAMKRVCKNLFIPKNHYKRVPCLPIRQASNTFENFKL